MFLLHGTPGCRIGPRPRSAILHRLGVRLICFDRPGYGESDRQPGRRVADAAADVSVIADSLGLDKFAVVGRSGGGPHALACAALLSERMTRVAVLVGLAPREAEADGLDWLDGMTDLNVTEYEAVSSGYAAIAAVTRATAEAVRADPASLLAKLQPELPGPDLRVITDPGIRSLLKAAYAEALRMSPDGWIDDALAFCAPWGFDPAAVSVPVLLWHGANDNLSPVSHARWLARRIPSAVVVIQAGAAHFGAIDVLPDILRWLTSDRPSARAGQLGRGP